MESFKGLASSRTILLIIMLIVVVIAVYLVVTFFLHGKEGLGSSKCMSAMYIQCTSCINNVYSGVASCSATCSLQSPSLSASDVSDCTSQLSNSGINILNDGSFSASECKKIGVNCTS